MDIEDAIFGAGSEDEREEAFEESTLKLVLAQLGWDSAQIKGTKYELGPAFGWEWFNGEDLVKPDVRSGRAFRFDFFDFLAKPDRSPITQMWDELPKSPEGNILIFKVFGNGRWLATNLDISHSSYIRVLRPKGHFRVAPFANFFKEKPT